MRRNLKFEKDGYYILHNCGVENRKIFLDNADYHRFLISLNRSNSKKPFRAQTMSLHRECFATIEDMDRLVDIGAYALLPDHFCILVRERVLGGVSKFIAKLSTGYTLYFNKRYGRSGSLLGGSFKARYITDECTLHHICNSLHLAPLKLMQEKDIDAEGFLKSYANSSYPDYAFKRERSQFVILNQESFPKDFCIPPCFKTFLSDCEKRKNKCGCDIPQIDGGGSFFDAVLSKLRSNKLFTGKESFLSVGIMMFAGVSFLSDISEIF